MKALPILIPLALLGSGWLLLAADLKTIANNRQPERSDLRCCQPYADHCPACKDCSACQWCSVKGGTCSVCLTAQ